MPRSIIPWPAGSEGIDQAMKKYRQVEQMLIRVQMRTGGNVNSRWLHAPATIKSERERAPVEPFPLLIPRRDKPDRGAWCAAQAAHGITMESARAKSGVYARNAWEPCRLTMMKATRLRTTARPTSTIWQGLKVSRQSVRTSVSPLRSRNRPSRASRRGPATQKGVAMSRRRYSWGKIILGNRGPSERRRSPTK